MTEMSSPMTVKRAVAVVCGVSAIVCASAAGYLWYKGRRNRSKTSSKSRLPTTKNRQSSSKSKKTSTAKSNKDIKENQQRRDEEDWSEEEQQSGGNEYTSDSSLRSDNTESSVKRRGRKKHRKANKPSIQVDTKSSETVTPIAAVQRQTSTKQEEEAKVFQDPAIISIGAAVKYVADQVNGEREETTVAWKDEADNAESGASSEAEISAAGAAINLAQVTTSKVNQSLAEASGTTDTGNGKVVAIENGTAQQAVRHHYAPSPSVKSQCADSPSLGSDFHSDASQDSGKGASNGVAASMSPVEELIEVPPVYEFEVPKDIVGLLIGKKGTTIKWLTEQSQAYIVIRDHFYSDKHKICTLEGTREQINKCLRLIRRKFPPSRFPELRLTPILPPPISTPRTPVWDNVVQLNLPEGVSCEVAVSSVVNVGHIFIQQPTHPTFPSLTRLDQYMLAVYSQPAGVPPLPHPIEMAVVCAAPVLGGWFRAMTMDYYDDVDEVLVKFVDYGGYCRVSASDLRQIRSDFMTLPFQATECYLSNISPIDESEGWSPDALTLLEQLVLSKVIDARVVGHSADNIAQVELYAPAQDSKPVFINQLLVDRGFAKWTDS